MYNWSVNNTPKTNKKAGNPETYITAYTQQRTTGQLESTSQKGTKEPSLWHRKVKSTLSNQNKATATGRPVDNISENTFLLAYPEKKLDQLNTALKFLFRLSVQRKCSVAAKFYSTLYLTAVPDKSNLCVFRLLNI